MSEKELLELTDAEKCRVMIQILEGLVSFE